MNTNPQTSNALGRLVIGTAWCAVATSLVLMALRGASAISFAEPLMVITSGAEEDSALAFWKYIEGLPVFEDPHRIPFVASAYNWLYYALYGEIARAVLTLMSLDQAWIPTIGRFTSLTVSLLGTALACVTLRMLAPRGTMLAALALPTAVFLFFGPLVGFWAISLNVELAATACAIAACLAVFRWYGSRPLLAVLAACLMAYLSWSMKQSHIFVVGAIVLFLLCRRDWRQLSLALMFFGAGWGVAILGGSEAYVKMLFFKGTDATLELSTFVRNFTNVAVKTTPITGLCALVFFVRSDWRTTARQILADDKALFALCGLAASLPLSMLMSAKQGAAENYYFVPVVFAVFSAYAVLAHVRIDGRRLALWRAVMIAGWLLSAAATGSVLAGWNGIVSVRHWHDRHVAEKACVRDLPAPLLPLSNPYLSVPWLYNKGPHFNLFYNYPRDRAAGRWFERGGAGGLIADGYFGSVLLGAGADPTFDGASLLPRYQEVETACSSMRVFVRKTEAGASAD